MKTNVVNLADFFTKAKANEGIKVPLPFPDGTASGKTLTILHLDSDAFQAARNDKLRANVGILALPEGPEREKAEEEAEIVLLSALVVGWDIDAEFSRDAVQGLFREAPYVRNLVDKTAADKNAFFGRKPGS